MATTATVDERLVSEIWERQAFDSKALVDLGADVVFRGVPSDAGGPDYQDAILCRRGGSLVHGDVEFHVASSDWYRHGHHLDPGYNRVVLHVVWEHDCAETRTSDGQQVPVLPLSAVTWLNNPNAERMTQRSLLPHPCEASYRSLPTATIVAKIRDLGILRFRSRLDHFSAELEAVPADQVAYAALLEAMGYASNREVFRLLAEVVPYAWLRSVSEERWEEILLHAAGLGPPGQVQPPGCLEPDCWRLSRIRPTNHPVLRLQGFAVLVQRLRPSLAVALESRVMSTERPGDLRAWLMARHDSQSYIGSGRADELLVSVVLPLCGAMRPDSSHPEELFRSYRSPPHNRWTRIMRNQLALAGHELNPRLAIEHQGMHFLYHQFCRPQRQKLCPVCNP